MFFHNSQEGSLSVKQVYSHRDNDLFPLHPLPRCGKRGSIGPKSPLTATFHATFPLRAARVIIASHGMWRVN